MRVGSGWAIQKHISLFEGVHAVVTLRLWKVIGYRLQSEKINPNVACSMNIGTDPIVGIRGVKSNTRPCCAGVEAETHLSHNLRHDEP